MDPFISFYDPKAMEPPLSETQVAKIQAKIFKELENSLKQVRSGRNLNCNIRNNHQTRRILGDYLDYLEDKECLRIVKEEKVKIKIHNELRKIVPKNYKI